MIDTRADVTIISVNTWPQSWPITAVGSVVAGLRGTTQSYLTSKSVLVKNTEGQTAMIHPYVTAAPLNLWGRHVASIGSLGRNGFLMRATVLKDVKHPTLALKWLTEQPVWVDQWPLEKLNPLKLLVQCCLVSALDCSVPPM